MLKWTVVKRDAFANPEQSRRASVGGITTQSGTASSAQKTKRRRRRSATAKRSSLCLDLNKENRFTSTPIKDEAFQADAFRDVSNLTPKKPKNLNDNSNYFKPFEAVDSHIEGSYLPLAGNITSKLSDCGCQFAKTPVGKRYAPTLPTYALDYSPTLDTHLLCQPKVEHVNEFLQRISLITSPEQLQLRLPGYRPNRNTLVKHFIERHSTSDRKHDDSSCINDLSLEKLVDAILDASDVDVEENEKNATQEQNLINEQIDHEHDQSIVTVTSTDSGFKEDQTMINLEGTFNERCVDIQLDSLTENNNQSRKRPADDRVIMAGPKLKRQKCIRKKAPKKIDDNSFDSDVVFDDAAKKQDKDATYVIAPPEIVRDLQESSIDLHVQCTHDQLIVTIFRCHQLKRNNGQPVNAYIKVALSDRCMDAGRRKHRGTLQRTAVQSESSTPCFAHTFRVPLGSQDDDQDVQAKVLYVEAWHRDRVTRRSEFLGCASFAIKDALKQNIQGTFKLSPQWPEPDRIAANNNHLATMAEHHTSIDELIADEHLDDPKKQRPTNALTEQQKRADENLFLRYLELDPVEGPEAGPAAAQRKASGNKTNGRTPFTMSKVLRRAPKSGFGFSVVWTHPPRIERVERNLPADKAGIQPGDYLIFVDKHNVVMMPEMDILNLIRSLGNQLNLETFRRDPNRNGSVPNVNAGVKSGSSRVVSIAEEGLAGLPIFEMGSAAGLPFIASSMTSVAATAVTGATAAPPSTATPRRPSTVCSTNTASVEYSRKKLHLPQVTFSSERPTNSADEARRKAMYQLIAREQQYATGMQFAVTRYVHSLTERKDLIAAQEHRTLFQNVEEILRISEEIVDRVIQVDGDYQTAILPKIYAAKLGEISTAYKRYCSGIKKADCVLANLLKNQEFTRFITTPAIPRRRPDLTTFVHKPLEHYREILKLFNVILTNTKTHQTEEYNVVNHIVHDLQATYREMTSQAGLMEPVGVGEGRPLLSVQDLETRLVFTKCKPFVLSKPGRQWIFGGDLSRVEGRTVRQYWALLFSDILLFAKVSRDRVLFILEEPLPLAHISDMFFNIRKKENEFRIVVEPGGNGATNRNNTASSPTVHCGPDLSRTPRKQSQKRCIVLRTPTAEMKSVWQNLLQRQIFHITSGLDGSSYSSPVESPDCQPITSSVMTLQSAESLPRHAQRPQPAAHQQPNNNDRKHIEELIEHKCKQLEKSASSSKSNAIHLEQWMKGQFTDVANNNDADFEDEIELWTAEQVRQRSEELKLINPSGPEMRAESRCEDLLDDDQSPSRSTNTTESQVTVRSSPLVPGTVLMCKKCHRTCQPPTRSPMTNGYKVGPTDEEDDWRSLMLMGLTAAVDPFAMPVPKIAVLPATPIPTPESQTRCNCNCPTSQRQLELSLNKSYDTSPDDSPLNEIDEQPYHSLHSSNLTLRRFGTVSSLERVGSEEDASYDVKEDSEHSDGNDIKTTDLAGSGLDNEGFNNTLMTWTARAGNFVAAKMAFLEKLPEYLKTEITLNGDEVQEEETSGGTSGEEIWGTPTSGGELDDPLSSPQYDDHNSPNGSLSSNEDTELMMDELLMTPPVTSSNIRGLLPRRTLEPLMEEEFSDTYTSSSSPSASPTPTEPSVSPEQGNGTGDAADECSSAVVTQSPPSSAKQRTSMSGATPTSSRASGTRLGVASLRSISTTLRLLAPPPPSSATNHTDSKWAGSEEMPIFIKRSDSYQKIIEEADDNVGFFTRFRNRPSMKYINIERIPPSKGVKFLEFFNVRRERKIYETFPGGRHLIKVFSREGDHSDEVPTSYAHKPEVRQRIKQERQLDRRFWKQLSKRRNSHSPSRTNSSSVSPILSGAKTEPPPSNVTQQTQKPVQPLSA